MYSREKVQQAMWIVSVSNSIIAVAIAYFIGIFCRQSWLGCILGVAAWLISIAVFTFFTPKKTADTLSKKEQFAKTGVWFCHSIALAWILPLGVIYPFLGDFYYYKEFFPLFNLDIPNWSCYSCIFSGVVTVGFIIYSIVKAVKK